MKISLLIFLLSLVCASSLAQYFFTGEVKDPHGDKLQNVSITVQSSHLTYKSDIYGDFGIISRKSEDTLTFSFEGYESYSTTARATERLQVTLKMLAFASASENTPPVSVIKKIQIHYGAPNSTSGHTLSPASPQGPPISASSSAPASPAGPIAQPSSEQTTGPAPISPAGLTPTSAPAADSARTPDTTIISYSSPAENPFVGRSSTVSFSANIGRASLPNIRRILGMGFAVPPEAVKIEEMLNYHNFYYEEPEGKELFHCSSDLVTCPWNAAHKLLYLNICTRKAEMLNAPAGNFVFLIDASGSMDMPNKLPLVKSGFRLLVQNLRNIDTISIVAFGGRTGIVMEGVSGAEKGKIIRAIESLEPDGPSPGGEGIQLAYQVAHRQFIEGGNNRIVLITDGDISEGASGEKELEDIVEQQNKDGIHLTCLGVGMRNYMDSQLPLLAEKGHGNFAYIDNEQQAERQLAEELAKNLCTMAENVYVTTGFNSILVKEFRLIGFSNKAAVREDSSFRLQGARVGSCNSLLALFELIPGKDSVGMDTLANVKISYCMPGQHKVMTMDYPCPKSSVAFERAKGNLKKAACIAMLGMKLQGSAYAARISWGDIEKMTRKNFTANDFMDREYISLVAKAKKIYEHRPVNSPGSGVAQ